MIDLKNKLFENPYVRTVSYWFTRVFLFFECVFLYSVIGVCILALISILQGKPFSIHINW